MSELKPYAWVVENVSTGASCVDSDYSFASSVENNKDWEVTPLYAIPEGYVLVPEEPTEDQWGGLARHLMMWLDLTGRPTGSNLYEHLDMVGEDAPYWLKEEIPDDDIVPSKGTRAAVIYKAMIKAAKEG